MTAGSAGDSARTNAELLKAAGAGDSSAWREMSDRYSKLLWWVTRGYRISSEDAADVIQICWVRLLEHVDRIRDPEHVDAWLVSVARRECLAVLRRAGRESLTLTDRPVEIVDPAAPAEAGLVRSERDQVLWTAFGAMSERCQHLLRLLTGEPKVAYRDIADLLDMPVGAIGPTRQRCLTSLRTIITAGGDETVALLSADDPDDGRSGWPRAQSTGGER